MLHSENKTDFTHENSSNNKFRYVENSNENNPGNIIPFRKPEGVLTPGLSHNASDLFSKILDNCSQELCTEDMLKWLYRDKRSRYRVVVNELCRCHLLTHIVVCNTDLYIINRFMVSKEMYDLKTALRKQAELD